MTSTDSFSAVVERLQNLLQIPPGQLQKRAYRHLVEEELRQTEASLYRLLNKHGVTSALELDKWLQEGKVEEARTWEDFFEIDALEYKRTQFIDILARLD